MLKALVKYIERPIGLALVSLIIVAIVLSPYLIGGKVIRGDSADGLIAYMSFLKNSFKNGESPFWNPYGAAGLPSFIYYSHPFSPLNLLLFILSPLVVHHLGLWLVLATALFFTVMVVKEIGGGFTAGFIAGLAFLIASLVYENNVVTAMAFAFQPFFFWLILKLVKSDSRRRSFFYVWILATALAFVWLSAGSNYQFATYTVIAGFVWVVYWTRRFKRNLLVPLAELTLGCGLGTIVGLIQLVPALAVLGQFSLRQGGFSFEYATSAAPVRWSDSVLFVHPFFAGRSAEAFLYIGFLPLFFFAISFFFKRIPYRKFFLLMFLVPLAIAFYKSPLLWVLQQLPVLSYFRHPSRIMIVGSFGAAVLAGLGSERFLEWIRNKLKTSPRQWAILVVLVIGLIVLDYVLVWQKKFGPETVEAKILMQSRFNKPLLDIAKEGRIFTVLPDDALSVFYWTLTNKPPPRDIDKNTMFAAATLEPNNQLFYQAETIELMDPLPPYLGRLNSLIGARVWGGNYGEEKLNKYKGAEGTPIDRLLLLKERSALLDFLGIRYLLSGFDLNEVGFDYRLVGHLPIEGIESGGYTFSFNTYENPKAKPLAYFAPVTALASDGETAYQKFKGSNFKGVFVECGNCDRIIRDSGGELELLERHNAWVSLKSRTQGERFLVFSQNYIPGWRAWINKEEADIFRVNSVFMGIFVPPGEHDIKFEFKYSDLLNPRLVFKGDGK